MKAYDGSISFDDVLYRISYQNLLLYGATLPSYDYDKKGSKDVINMDNGDNERYLDAINF